MPSMSMPQQASTPRGPSSSGCPLLSSVDLANNRFFGQLGGSGSEEDGTSWWELGQGTCQVGDDTNNYDSNNYDSNEYGNSLERLGFDWVPPYLPCEGSGLNLDEHFPDLSANTQNICDAIYNASQDPNGLVSQHLDFCPPLQQIRTLTGNDADVSAWDSGPVPRPIIQGLPLMQLDWPSSPLVDMPMQYWNLQYTSSSTLPTNGDQLAANLQLGQNISSCMSPYGWQTTSSTITAHTPDMAWQTSTGSNSSTSPISWNSDQFVCDYPSCKVTKPSQKELKRHQKSHKKPHVCDEPGCQFAFAAPAQLERHRKTHRRGNLDASEKYQCPTCSRTYTRNMSRGFVGSCWTRVELGHIQDRAGLSIFHALAEAEESQWLWQQYQITTDVEKPALGMACWGDRCVRRPAKGFYPFPAL
ncbi:hypothetical protein NEUTE1DRAFT_104188 [Neurospora tetrasperma FGSC 2508]|uniref:C2H2-type domain-containing protein n=1 Tax=Neurospora tetrasperma (strain FGSC 2508 / ATCC MYA-4615 / P0657) TaxID=510951 RepID=F8MVG1_NEUT8|nr:uncharacterized protein NEUTE1DRAFT_104188 [Neurospora tetrasperma FGSC 2508]EGO54764.1 hypothetical protein NEUTE1DRAFT_104188 [Neurospora tetrasperma FGSC 2508]